MEQLCVTQGIDGLILDEQGLERLAKKEEAEYFNDREIFKADYLITAQNGDETWVKITVDAVKWTKKDGSIRTMYAIWWDEQRFWSETYYMDSISVVHAFIIANLRRIQEKN